VPAVFVRSTAKTHFLSYGGEPGRNHPRLSGERLPDGANMVVIDDLLHSGETVVSAAE
jgi:adenine/guanine phosphoribosyltransferase-like PRPP-binding protein